MNAKNNPFETDLDKNPANYAPLTPLSFIERTAYVYPKRTAVIHGARRYTWEETYARCRRLASALAKRGVGIGNSVAVMLANTPEMYECHFGVPMTGGVLLSLNTRLDAAAIGFMLQHGEAKVLITDREFSPTVKAALAFMKTKPEVIDVDDSEYAGPGDRLGTKTYEELLQPKWKSNMFLDDEAYEWFAVLLKHFGREKGLQYMKSLAKQDLRMVRGRTAQSQLLAAGERALAIVLSGHTVWEMKTKGAPLEGVILDPYFAQANKLMLSRHAPHPHAAALFYDWALSEEGQAIITSFGRVIARKGVKQRFPELVDKESFLVDVDFIGPIMDQTGKEFSQIFLGR